MNRKPQGTRRDQNPFPNGQPTPPSSRDDYGPGSRKSSSRRRSTSQTQPDRSNSASPESVFSPFEHHGTIYEEPDALRSVVPVNPNTVRRQRSDPQHEPYHNQRRYHRRADEERRAQDTSQAAANFAQRDALPLGHQYKGVKINGARAKVHAGDIIEEGTDPRLLSRSMYGDFEMDSAAGQVYQKAQEGRRSSSNLVMGNIYLKRGGATIFYSQFLN